MKGTKKRLLSLLLTVVMLLGMLPAVTVPAAAAETAVAANKKELKTLLASDGDLHITLQPDPNADYTSTE